MSATTPLDAPSPLPPSDPPAEISVDYLFGPFRLSPATRELRRGDTLVPLTAKTFDTLVVLVRHHGRVVGKDELMKAVWHEAAVSDDSLTQNIKALRRALGDDAAHPEYIGTLARRGYRFIPPVETVEHGQALTGPEPLTAPGGLDRRDTASGRRRPGVLVLLGGAVAVALATLGILVWAAGTSGTSDTPIGTLRLPLALPVGVTLQEGGALSPDGRFIAFVASGEGQGPSLWITDFETGDARPIPETAAASRPFWSPDSRLLGYFAAGSLRTVAPSGGPSRALAGVRRGNGGTWTEDGQILFADLRSPIRAIDASGGASRAVTTLDTSRQDIAHLIPQALPNGRFLFYLQSPRPELAGTYLGSLGSSDTMRVLDVQATYAPGALLFVRDRVLFAQPFDLDTVRLTGTAIQVAEDVDAFDVTQFATVSASSGGVLAYGGGASREQLAWLDRSGRRLATITAPTALYNPRLSVDDRQLLAASRPGNGQGSIWTVDLAREVPTRITEGMRPELSPDGSEVAFTRDLETGIADIYVQPLSGANRSELLVRSPENKMVNDWTRDGTLVYSSTSPATKTDIWLLSRGGGTPRPFLRTSADEMHAQVSPDGRLIAYASDESGRFEIYLQTFPEPGQKIAASVGGGLEPHWRADGRELYYLALDGGVMAVRVEPDRRPAVVGRPVALFRPAASLNRGLYVRNYDVSADGQRFLMGTSEPGMGPAITLVVNWPRLLER